MKAKEVTEEWIEKKAEELIINLDLVGCPISVRKAKDFIRLLIKEIRGK